MKKITLIIAAALVSVAGFAQDVLIDRPNDNTTGLIATEGNDGTGVYCADQFELTSEVALGDLTVFGFSSTGLDITPLVTGFNVYIFEDFSGLPGGNPEVGGGVAELDVFNAGLTIDTSDGYDVTVAMTDANGGDQVILPAGTYWMCAFPTVDSPPTGDGRWNWQGSLGTEPAVEPVLIDPADLFGSGATDWTNISGLIAASFPSFGWTLTDEEIILGVGDNLEDMVSIYPNPTTDVLNVSIPSNVEVESTQLIDVLGRNTGLQLVNGQLNTSNLATGVYVLRIETSAGSLTRKIVKK